ncbi:MAG TPA: hypothetical protein VFS75_02245 [Candidatus Paceibacterota bacterium]|nr:hypothetical protein [Candidatus Paceibacterota bacterium]
MSEIRTINAVLETHPQKAAFVENGTSKKRRDFTMREARFDRSFGNFGIFVLVVEDETGARLHIGTEPGERFWRYLHGDPMRGEMLCYSIRTPTLTLLDGLDAQMLDELMRTLAS